MSAEAPLLQTKLDVPLTRGHVVARERLLAHLPAAPGTRLVLLSAPAGFGKTTLLAAWCRARAAAGRAAAWLALDASDNNLASFLIYLRASIMRADRSAAALLATKSATGDHFLTELVNVMAALDHDLVLVLDDYHVIDAPDMHAAVAFLLDHLPEHVCLALGSRADPPLPLARLRAREQLVELRSPQLRFTPEETRTILSTCCDQARALCACTEGWPVGIQLLAHGVRAATPAPNGAPPTARFDASLHHVFAYLADEVFDRLSPHLKTFLLQTSMLDQLCAPLCDAVMGVEDKSQGAPARATLENDSYSRLVLEELERANLFLLPLDEERRWYRFHHLFRAFLQARLALELPGTLAELHRRASAWFERHGLWAEANAHARATTVQHACSTPGNAALELGVNSLTPAVQRAPFDAAHAHSPATQTKRMLMLAPYPTPQFLIEALSERELEVLRLIAAGASNQVVAQTLVISLGTVKSHINHILGKLAATNRTEAVAHARNLGLIPD